LPVVYWRYCVGGIFLMAMDAKDKKTIDAFPAKQRGRPSTGSAKTAAQRMAEKRQRDRELLSRASLAADYSQLTTPALIECLPRMIADKQLSVVRKIAAELIKRAK